MIENESETTPNELEIAIQKRNRKYQKPFKNGSNCCKKNVLKNNNNKLSDISNNIYQYYQLQF